jgi:hypothetical protein
MSEELGVSLIALRVDDWSAVNRPFVSSLFFVAPPMNSLNVVQMVISPSSSHPFRVSVIRYDVAAVGKFMVANGALPALLDDFSVQ